MGALFRADLFSASHPVFVPVGDEVARRVRAVTGRFFQHRLGTITQIEQFGGKEINSNNFKLSTAAGAYLLKQLPGGLDVRVLERQLRLMIWLHDCRIAVPGVRRNDGGDLVSEQDGFHWCLLDFVDGDFFSGSDAELTP